MLAKRKDAPVLRALEERALVDDRPHAAAWARGFVLGVLVGALVATVCWYVALRYIAVALDKTPVREVYEHGKPVRR